MINLVKKLGEEASKGDVKIYLGVRMLVEVCVGKKMAMACC
jgi:hypothetical protein